MAMQQCDTQHSPAIACIAQIFWSKAQQHVSKNCPPVPCVDGSIPHTTIKEGVTQRDNVTSCHAVTHWRLWLKATNGNRVFSGVRRCQPVGRSGAHRDCCYCTAHCLQGATP
jgi:hypothetical protein